LVKSRRNYAEALAKGFERGNTETFIQGIVSVQAAIDVIDRAFEDEKLLRD
jgi:hypothetical protein